jgi:hypothetical protein
MFSKKNLIIILLHLFIISNGFAQHITTKEIADIHYRIYKFMEQNTPKSDTANSEFIFIVLLTDSTNKIAEVHLLADEKNHDKGYYILSKMSPSLFKDIKLSSFSNKTIVVPIYWAGTNTRANCADFTLWDVPLFNLPVQIMNEGKRSVVTAGIQFYYDPATRREQF